jgi:hypothetical protein
VQRNWRANEFTRVNVPASHSDLKEANAWPPAQPREDVEPNKMWVDFPRGVSWL